MRMHTSWSDAQDWNCAPVMAQRQGELLKMEMLEKLASLHRELMKEVALATEAGGASASAVDTARELLGNENCSNFLKARHSGVRRPSALQISQPRHSGLLITVCWAVPSGYMREASSGDPDD